MTNVTLTINDKRITAPKGQSLLRTALENDIYIPNLCAILEINESPASCRLCFVEIKGKPEPVTACTESINEGMFVDTRGPDALRLARTALELLLASHPVDCIHCAANGQCELQRAAKHLGIKMTTKRFRKLIRDLPIDDTSPVFIYNPNKCVLCGKCVSKCREVGEGAIGFAYRGFERMVTSFGGEPIGQSPCNHCLECVEACPVGALVEKETQ